MMQAQHAMANAPTTTAAATATTRSTRNRVVVGDATPRRTSRPQRQGQSSANAIDADDHHNDHSNKKKGPTSLTGDACDDRPAHKLFAAWYLNDGARSHGLKADPDDIDRVWQYMLPPRAPTISAKWCRAYWMRQEAANAAARWGTAADVAVQIVRKTSDGVYASLDDVVRQITRTTKNARGRAVLVMATHALEEAGWRFVLRRTQSKARERVVPLDSIDALVDALCIILVDEPEIDAVRCYSGSAAHGSLVGWELMLAARQRRAVLRPSPDAPQPSPGVTSPALPSSSSSSSILSPLPSASSPSRPPVSSPSSFLMVGTLPTPAPKSPSPSSCATVSCPPVASLSANWPKFPLPVILRNSTMTAPPTATTPSLPSAIVPPNAVCANASQGATNLLYANDSKQRVNCTDASGTFDIDLNNPPADDDHDAWAAVSARHNPRKRSLDFAATATKRLCKIKVDDRDQAVAHAPYGASATHDQEAPDTTETNSSDIDEHAGVTDQASGRAHTIDDQETDDEDVDALECQRQSCGSMQEREPDDEVLDRGDMQGQPDDLGARGLTCTTDTVFPMFYALTHRHNK